MLLASRPSNPIRRLVMNDIGAYLPMDALQAIARNLQAPAHFASLDEVEAHMRHTHRTWGEITDEQWKHFALHGSRPDGDGYRLHFDPQITAVAQPFPLGPGLFFWDAWYRVRCPVLLLRGEDSTIFPPDVAATMIDVKPDTELVEVSNCGHAPALMSAGQIATVVDYLLRPATQPQWQRLPFSSSPGSSKTPMRSGSSSRVSARSPPSPSPT
jgi:pimeloyl-ACP methyl ester carboxylesterase